MPLIEENIYSASLSREVRLSILLPVNYDHTREYPLLLFNDGQDFPALNLTETVSRLQQNGEMLPAVVVGMHASEQRLHEYGTALKADYAGRGSKAAATTAFVTSELIPYLQQHYRIAPSGNAYAGFSLGGLMALDVVWNHPELFSCAGVFSGSLWWRQKAIGDGYHDSDRIMHAQIGDTHRSRAVRCWFECGTEDEQDDRDGDGVIDSIQDTLDCIAALERKGLVWNRDVFYTEVTGGQHNPATWGRVMPDFLKWVSCMWQQ